MRFPFFFSSVAHKFSFSTIALFFEWKTFIFGELLAKRVQIFILCVKIMNKIKVYNKKVTFIVIAII